MMISIITGNLCCMKLKTRTAKVTICIISKKTAQSPSTVTARLSLETTTTQRGSKHRRDTQATTHEW